MDKNKTSFQLTWGILLILAGIGVLFKIPFAMPKIEAIEYFSRATLFIRFCLYLMAILLIGGGSRKIYEHYQKPEKDESDE